MAFQSVISKDKESPSMLSTMLTCRQGRGSVFQKQNALVPILQGRGSVFQKQNALVPILQGRGSVFQKQNALVPILPSFSFLILN